MMDGGTFNINKQTKPVNKDIVVSFSPSENIVHYSYAIYKDGKVVKTVLVNTKAPSNIVLDATGNYQISVTSYDSLGQQFVTNSGIYTIDKDAPILKLSDKNIEIKKHDQAALNDINITASDNHDGNLTAKITSNNIDLSTTGVKTLTYTVSDEAGNVAQKDVDINVVSNFNQLLLFQIGALIILFLILIPIIRIRKNFKLEKRLDPFIIEPTKSHNISFFDRLFNYYHGVLTKIIGVLKFSNINQKYATKLEKYTKVSSIHSSGMEILAGKVVIALAFLIIVIFSITIQFKMISVYEIIIPLIIGFFVLDILYFVKYKIYRQKLENDLLSAIIVMNNAFKSGRSITQAIDIVSNEVEGEIGKEFKKMSLELSYGLGIDVIFKRFADRVKLDEVNYLTASLSILNKTGGNITEVFSAIEKTLFNKKKLRLELRSLTGSSKIIVYVLFTVPFLFVLFVSFINPSYFLPFINTKLGIMMLLGMIIYYIIFIICVRKIMRVVI